ncbi:hypothetical protein GK1377 [Geobacillus kaustophilus HTA426]|uniref:Uncharacterized protein n=1 Tax=Geobacillus kaustophilus (strain HTA426) TaxID=235909 RepID=Q5L074_GEOKA|nr:hypothetical protein GK1377 [Geobacillus kaustophilus HTA426]
MKRVVVRSSVTLRRDGGKPHACLRQSKMGKPLFCQGYVKLLCCIYIVREPLLSSRAGVLYVYTCNMKSGLLITPHTPSAAAPSPDVHGYKPSIKGLHDIVSFFMKYIRHDRIFPPFPQTLDRGELRRIWREIKKKPPHRKGFH